MLVQYHGLDTAAAVYFYEPEFYVLSNFSAFQIEFYGRDFAQFLPDTKLALLFATSEHCYHWLKFIDWPVIQQEIIKARSAHVAYQLARGYREQQRADWPEIKVEVMRQVLLAKLIQHPYVGKKLLQTGQRQLIENSWRDAFWGEGADRTGVNMLGQLWMQLRQQVINRAICLPYTIE